MARRARKGYHELSETDFIRVHFKSTNEQAGYAQRETITMDE